MTLRDFTTLEWAHDAPPPPAQIGAIAALVFADLDAEIDHPRQCVFHIVSLTDDAAGPSAFVWGDRMEMVFHCRYRAVTEWD